MTTVTQKTYFFEFVQPTRRRREVTQKGLQSRPPPKGQPRRPQTRPQRPTKASQTKPSKQACEQRPLHATPLPSQAKQSKATQSKATQSKSQHSNAKQGNKQTLLHSTSLRPLHFSGRQCNLTTPRKAHQPKQHRTNLFLYSPTVLPQLCALGLVRRNARSV